MFTRLLFSAMIGAMSVGAAAQAISSDTPPGPAAASAVENRADNSVNTQSTAAQDARNTEAASTMSMPSSAERAKDLAPMMEIPAWQAGAGAAKAASGTAQYQGLPPQRVELATPGATQALQHESTP